MFGRRCRSRVMRYVPKARFRFLRRSLVPRGYESSMPAHLLQPCSDLHLSVSNSLSVSLGEALPSVRLAVPFGCEASGQGFGAAAFRRAAARHSGVCTCAAHLDFSERARRCC